MVLSEYGGIFVKYVVGSYLFVFFYVVKRPTGIVLKMRPGYYPGTDGEAQS